MTEIGIRFGPDDGAIGVLTRPESAAGAPAVVHVLFNAGVIHRVGPHRVYVRLARALAAQGHWVLRFDLSAHGDSRPQAGGLDPRVQAQADIRAAMDCVEQRFGATRFALLGICSGAVHSYWTALQDSRVAGVFMLDGFWYRTWRTMPIRHWKRITNQPLRVTLSALARRLAFWRSFGKTRAESSPATTLGRSALANPPLDSFVQGMGQLSSRGCAVLVAYSGSVLEYYSYEGQFRDRFRHEAWFDSVRYAFSPELDHTLTSRQAQQAFIDLVLQWAPEASRAAERMR